VTGSERPGSEQPTLEERHPRNVDHLAARRRGRWQGRWDRNWPPDQSPPWWPANEPWPSGHRPRPWRGFGCLFGLLFVAGVLGLLTIGLNVVGYILAAQGPFADLIRVAAVLVALAIAYAVLRAGRAVRFSGDVLDDLVAAASRIEAGDYTARIGGPIRGPRPLRDLVRGFDTMAARLELDEEQRRTLIADVTHELRTPLAVVQGNVEAMLDCVHPPDAEHLGAILDETRVLARLVDDLRTLALSESGSLSLHREPTDLGILVADVLTSFEATARAAGLEIAASVDDDVPMMDVDPVRMREVLTNLVTNAIRHTPAGGRVEVEARLVATESAGDSQPGSVRIEVRDTGVGIDPALLSTVFDRFVRSSTSGGSGLGLAIARGLVELHGGRIAATNRATGGTVLTIDLPVSS
jgi:signal transduction histidine kinase